MPLDLDDVLNDVKWVPAQVGGHTFTVAYRPSVTSLRRQAQMAQMQRMMKDDASADELEQMRSVAGIFCDVIAGWDLTRGGKPLAIDVETVLDLPEPIYQAIMDAITGDRQSQQEEKKASKLTSGATSTPEGNLAIAQNGILPSAPRSTWA